MPRSPLGVANSNSSEPAGCAPNCSEESLRNPWVFTQLAIAGLLLVLSVMGILGLVVFDAVELAFTPQGAIHAFAVFPGLILSLVVNALIMRAHRRQGLNLAEKILLGVEFALIAALLVFHFYIDPAGNTFGLAIATWPVVILLAIAITIVAAYRNATGPTLTRQQ